MRRGASRPPAVQLTAPMSTAQPRRSRSSASIIRENGRGRKLPQLQSGRPSSASAPKLTADDAFRGFTARGSRSEATLARAPATRSALVTKLLRAMTDLAHLHEEEDWRLVPALDEWLDAWEARPSYIATKSDYYTIVHAVPSQNGPAFPVPESFDIAARLDGLDGEWAHDDLEPLAPLQTVSLPLRSPEKPLLYSNQT